MIVQVVDEKSCVGKSTSAVNPREVSV